MMDVKSSEAAEEPKRDVDQSAAVEYSANLLLTTST